MKRRAFLAGATAGTATVAGCSIFGGDGGSGDPTDPVATLLDGYTANGSDAGASAVHSDGPLAEDLPAPVDDRSLALENTTVVSEDDDTATVRANVTVGGGSERWNEQREFEVRMDGGDWAVWSMSTGPEFAVERFFEAHEADRTDDVLAILHDDSPSREWLDATVVEGTSLTLQSTSIASTVERGMLDVAFTEVVGTETTERERQVELRRTPTGWRIRSLRFGPVVPVYSYARAITENDAEGYRRMLHPDVPDESVSERGLGLIEAMSVEAIEVESMTSEEASIRVTLALTFLDQEESIEGRFAVRPYEGEWRLYEEL